MSLVPLADLLDGARAENHPIARTAAGIARVRQLRGDVAATTSRLANHRVRRAILACDDSYRFVAGLLALLRSGAEIVLPPNRQPETLRTLGASCDAIVTDGDATGLDGAIFVAEGEGAAAPFRLDVADRPIDFFTSGSTGEMKRVRKTLGAFAREAAALEGLWGAALGEAAVAGMVTHQHVFGMTFRIMWPLLAGRCFDATIHFAWESLLAGLTGPTAIVASPAHLTRLGGVAPLGAAERPRLIFTAGAPLPAATAGEAASILGTMPIEIFGSTETGVIAWRSGPADEPLWQPLPGVDILPNDGGLLRVRSDFLDGAPWLDLADRVTPLGDGRFRFDGRADRVVKIEGKRVSLEEIERGIAALPWVDQACAVPIDDGHLRLGAVVVLNARGRAELALHAKFRFERLLRRELAAGFDWAVVPRRWRFVDAMPADAMGKRRVQDLVALLQAPS